MPVDSTHPHYNNHKASVTEDAYDGDVLDYVPKLTKQNNDDYEAYRQRGVYFNVTKRTVEAMVGAALRKPFVTDLKDVLTDGNQSLAELVSNILRGLIIYGRSGILVDFDEENGSPKLIHYKHKYIINWRDDRSMVVLHEDAYVPKEDDPFELEEVERYRVLYIDPETGFYTVRLYQRNGKTAFDIIDEQVPLRRGQPLDFIPFIFITPFDTSTKCYDPVVYNLAQLNISHFKTVVDLEHGAHFTALPTPYLIGDWAEDMGGHAAIGGDYFLQAEMGSTIDYLEFSGAGLKTLEERRLSKEEQMATLGAQLVAHKGVESADALKIRSAAETATLNNIVTSTESAMQQALTIYSWWRTSGDTVEPAQFEMSRDFVASKLSPQEMVALMQLYLAGTISQETYLENLFEGEITQDVEEEMQRLVASQPSVQGAQQ